MNEPIGLSTPSKKKITRFVTNNDINFSDDDDDDGGGNNSNNSNDNEDFSSSSILLPPPFVYSNERTSLKKDDSDYIRKKQKSNYYPIPLIRSNKALHRSITTQEDPSPSNFFSSRYHDSNIDETTTSFSTTEDDEVDNNQSYWWDNEDVINPNCNRTKGKKISNNTIIDLAINNDLVRLYKTRCIIHQINTTAFQDLCDVFKKYYFATISNLDSVEKTFVDMIQDICSTYVQIPSTRNYHYAAIINDISQITDRLFTKRCVTELSRLLAMRDYIINAENYINFHGKCLLDCYYLMKYGYDFNFYKNAILQWNIQSEYVIFVNQCIKNYAKRANNILYNKIKNGRFHDLDNRSIL